MAIRQGDIYYVDAGAPQGSEPALNRPAVVLQSDFYNETRLNTTVICYLTSNELRKDNPENVLIAKGETGLRYDSVALATSVTAINKWRLDERVGRVKAETLAAIIRGVTLVMEPRSAEDDKPSVD